MTSEGDCFPFQLVPVPPTLKPSCLQGGLPEGLSPANPQAHPQRAQSHQDSVGAPGVHALRARLSRPSFVFTSFLASENGFSFLDSSATHLPTLKKQF